MRNPFLFIQHQSVIKLLANFVSMRRLFFEIFLWWNK